MLAWLLITTFLSLAHSEPYGERVQEHAVENVSSSRLFCFGPCLTAPLINTCFALGGQCLSDTQLTSAGCDFVDNGKGCSCNCKCCLKCQTSGTCRSNGGSCHKTGECPSNTYIDPFSFCLSPSGCVCCKDCTQNAECMQGVGGDSGTCVGNKDELLLMKEYYMPNPAINCANAECECVLKCSGSDCESVNGKCIVKSERCPPGMKKNRCGCNSNSCKCCIPNNASLPCP